MKELHLNDIEAKYPMPWWEERIINGKEGIRLTMSGVLAARFILTSQEFVDVEEVESCEDRLDEVGLLRELAIGAGKLLEHLNARYGPVFGLPDDQRCQDWWDLFGLLREIAYGAKIFIRKLTGKTSPVIDLSAAELALLMYAIEGGPRKYDRAKTSDSARGVETAYDY